MRFADPASAISYGAGYLWATVPGSGSIARISLAKRNTKIQSSIGSTPTRSVAVGRRVYVTMNLDHQIAVIDPATATPIGRRIDVPPNPYAITADARSLWVTGLGNDTLTRVPLP